MGIHDRHYIRERRIDSGMGGSRGGAFGSVRALSVNTWLIVICVLIYVIDGFTPTRYVFGQMTIDQATEIPATAVADQSVRPVLLPDRARPIPVLPLLNEPNGQQIGWIDVHPMQTIQSYLHFSTSRLIYTVEYWRLIGFQFLHATPMHLLFNMIALYFFGPLIEQHLGSKRYLAFYLLCGIFGALLYTLLNLGGYVAQIMNLDIQIPGLLFDSPAIPLMGASAGVFGVLMAGAHIAPRATVLLFFILPMQLRTLAYALVVIAFVSLFMGTANAGGEAGHLGGALAGWYFIRHQHHLHGFFDFLGRFDPTSRQFRKKHRAKAGHPASRKEIDRILDKINREGLHSLNDAEKRALREASRHAE